MPHSDMHDWKVIAAKLGPQGIFGSGGWGREDEKWQVIPATNRRYFASDEGRVISLARSTPNILSASSDLNRYLRLSISPSPGNRVPGKVHQFVAIAWLDGYFEGAVVDHLNGNKADNRPNNLEWVSLELNSKRYQPEFGNRPSLGASANGENR